MAKSMQAWQYPHPGPLETTLRLAADVPRPSPSSLGPHQILVQVRAAGLNPADFKVQELGLIARAVTTFPKTASLDLSGRVVAAGPAVTDVRPGDNIVGRLDHSKAPGALSQVVVVDRHMVTPLPPGVDVVKAAGLPTAALSAYQSLKPHVVAGRGDRVLINGGSGGVGTFGIQMAKIMGCHVTTTCSTTKVGYCKDLGADEVVDYKTSSVMDYLRGRASAYSLVVDNVGNSPPDLFSSGSQYLQPKAPYVFVGGQFSFASVRNILASLILPVSLGGSHARFTTFMAKDSSDDLAQIVDWYAQGRLRVPVDSTFKFSDAKAALQYVKAGSVTGKVIVVMGDDE